MLTLMILLPLLSSGLMLIVPKSGEHLLKWAALIVCVIEIAFTTVITIGFNGETTRIQFEEHHDWLFFELGNLGKLSVTYALGLDGLNYPLLLLTVLILFIGVLASWKLTEKLKAYFSLYMLLSASVIGCFAALDFFLFYVFFEFMLLPMYFLIGIWGGKRREYAAIKFFIYTLVGSIFILMAGIALYLSTADPVKTAEELRASGIRTENPDKVISMFADDAVPAESIVHTFDMQLMRVPENYIPGSILSPDRDDNFRLLIAVLLVIGFAVKLPAVPLHTWLPDAHVEAPTAISVILAGVLLKIGGYGIARLGYWIMPEEMEALSFWIGLAGTVSIVYGGLVALGQSHLKRMIAYASVSHMGFVLLGLASGTPEGTSGAVYQMVSHGVLSAMLFLVAGVLSDRTHNLTIEHYEGLLNKMPVYGAFTAVAFFASLGLPVFSAFVAELFIFIGAFRSETLPVWMAALSLSGLLISASYLLWTYRKMFMGSFWVSPDLRNNLTLSDLDIREKLMFSLLLVFTILLGVWPGLLLDLTEGMISLLFGK